MVPHPFRATPRGPAGAAFRRIARPHPPPRTLCSPDAQGDAAQASQGQSTTDGSRAFNQALGAPKAASTRALCFFLLWGKTTGNTVNSARRKLLTLRPWELSPTELFTLVYYGPLFAVIGLTNALLLLAPPVPPAASAAFGACLWVPQASAFAPRLTPHSEAKPSYTPFACCRRFTWASSACSAYRSRSYSADSSRCDERRGGRGLRRAALASQPPLTIKDEGIIG